MSPDRDPGRSDDDRRDLDDYDDESPRSIFSALWFRALLAVLVLGVLAAVAVPYVLDFATTPALKGPGAKSAAPATSPTAPPAGPSATAVPAPAEAPAAPAPATDTPTAPAAAPPAPAAAKPSPAAPVAKSSTSAKPPATVAKAAESPKTASAPKATPAVKPSPAKADGAGSSGPYWVQVGAFKDAETAKRLVATLREQGLQVESTTTTATAAKPAPASTTAQSAADRYDVVVSGASAADVDAKLAPRGMTGESTANGIVVRPSLSLRDAVALSRDLADAGLSVQVRRIGGPAPTASTAPSPADAGETLHRVRVGGFSERAAAVAALKRLEEKGFKPFIPRPNE